MTRRRTDAMPADACRVRRGARIVCAAVAFLAAALIASPALAHGYRLGDIMIGHLWSPPSHDGGTSVYGPFLNQGPEADRLVAASTSVAEQAKFCASEKAGGECRAAIELAPGKPYALAPWRTAIRITGLKRPLEEGDRYPLTLRFEKAGTVTVDIVVERSAGH